MANTVKKTKRGASAKAKTQPVNENQGTIRVSLGATLNMGDYQSARIDVGITLPFDANAPGAKDTIYQEAREWTQTKVREEMARLGKAL